MLSWKNGKTEEAQMHMAMHNCALWKKGNKLINGDGYFLGSKLYFSKMHIIIVLSSCSICFNKNP